MFTLGTRQFQLSAGLLADIEKTVVVETGAPGGADHDGDRRDFALPFADTK